MLYIVEFDTAFSMLYPSTLDILHLVVRNIWRAVLSVLLFCILVLLSCAVVPSTGFRGPELLVICCVKDVRTC